MDTNQAVQQSTVGGAMAPMHTEPMEQELKDITTVQKHVRMQKVSPVEVVIACLKRIEQLNPELNAFITLPCGCDSNGLPLGLQMVGKPWDEATVLGLAYRYETTTSWKNKHPAA